MAADNQNQNEPAKLFRPWVGVLMSLFVSGSAHFLSGNKLAGIGWFTSLWILFIGVVWCWASPLVPGDTLGIAVWFVSIILWVIMLVKSYRPVPRFRIFGWLFLIALNVVIQMAAIQGLRTFCQPAKTSASMFPTIRGDIKRSDGTIINGDHFFIRKYAYWFSQPQRGDVVAFKNTGISLLSPGYSLYIKRIVGMPGDVLSVQHGQLFNHGQPVFEPPVLANLAIWNPSVKTQIYLVTSDDDYKVPDRCYFVIGDNTTNSLDSRFFGAIPEANIVGKVSKIYWPLQRAGKIE